MNSISSSFEICFVAFNNSLVWSLKKLLFPMNYANRYSKFKARFSEKYVTVLNLSKNYKYLDFSLLKRL